MQETPLTLDAAYRYCERLARTHYENFTVGSRLLPKAKRRHVHAVYAYCRTVDDLGDEAAASPATVMPPQPVCRRKREPEANSATLIYG